MTNGPCKWGWRRDKEDRDFLIDAALPVAFSSSEIENIPEELDPRDWLQIEYQGAVGSCAGHARTTAHELAIYWATGQVVQLSRMHAYLTAQKEDGLLGRDQGSSITGNMRAARKVGTCFEATYPYPGHYTTRIPAEAVKEAENHKLRNHAYCSTYEDVFRFLAARFGGVQIGVGWNGWTPDGRGVIERVGNGGGGGHSICFVGYSKRLDRDGRKYLWAANSWGVSWGLKGFAEVAPSVVDYIGTMRGRVEMIGQSDLEGFDKPRPTDWSKVV